MKPTENIAEAVKKDLNYIARADLHDRMLDDVLKAQEKSKNVKPPVTRPNIGRLIMISPRTKFAAAAVMIIAGVLSISLFNKSITPSTYALEQTIEAVKNVRTLHMRMSCLDKDGSRSLVYWFQFDEAGKVTNVREDYFGDENEGDKHIKHWVWYEGISKVWWPLRNVVYITRSDKNEMEQKCREFLKNNHPEFLFQRLYDESIKNKSIKFNIHEPTKGSNDIFVEVIRPGEYTREELIVDFKTKFVKQYTRIRTVDDEDVFRLKTEYLGYNQPINPNVFVLSEIPEDAVVYGTSEMKGLEQGDLTDGDIAVEVVRACLEATILKNYEEVSRLVKVEGGDPVENYMASGEMIEKFIEDTFGAQLVQIISTGEPISCKSWSNSLYVPCEIEIENPSSKWVENIGVMAKPFKFESGNRWIVSSIMRTRIIIPGESVGDLQFGMSRDEVFEILGKPEFIRAYGDEEYTPENPPLAYFMDFGDITFGMFNNSIDEIAIENPYYRFPNGLGVGDSEQSVIQTFGDNFQLRESGQVDVLIYEEKGLEFKIHREARTVLEFIVREGQTMNNDFGIEPGYRSKGIIIPGKSVGALQFGMGLDDVLKILGKPTVIFNQDEKYTLDNLPSEYGMDFKEDITVAMADHSIDGISIRNPYSIFADGWGVGDSEQNVIRTFGDHFQLRKSDKYDFLIYQEKGLSFKIYREDRIVLEINVSQTE